MSEETRQPETPEAQPELTSTDAEALDAQIRENLRQVVDPEIGLDVVALGLIKEILFQNGQVQIKMLLTTPFCPYAPWMVQMVKEKAQEVVPNRTVDVEVLPEPWDPSMMEDPSMLGFGPGMF
ncbi:MAG: metal-sulfur cluster assembly factor [Ardenticatenia bacterium]|nr:metal-sulfur cluster assembly factor [Ardenticatenia bacterium]